MPIRSGSLNDSSSALVDRLCNPNVCAINYEEPPPDNWYSSVGNPTLGGGAAAPAHQPEPQSTRPVTGTIARPSLPPPPPPKRGAAAARNLRSQTETQRFVTGAHGPQYGSDDFNIEQHGAEQFDPEQYVEGQYGGDQYGADEQAPEQHIASHYPEQAYAGETYSHPYAPQPYAAQAYPQRDPEEHLEAIASLTLPPAPLSFGTIPRGEALLPERANDPTYYPGLVNDPEPDPSLKRQLPSWWKYAAAGAGLLLTALVARGLFSGPKTYSAVIDVTPPEAHVTVDGTPLEGAAGARTREGLMVGDHVIVATQPGYETKREVFQIADSDRRVVVLMDREKPPEPPPAPKEPDVVDALQTSAPSVPAANPAYSPTPLEQRIDTTGMSKKEIARLKRQERIAERYRERKAASADRKQSADDRKAAAAERRAAAAERRAAAKAERAERAASRRGGGAEGAEPTARAAKGGDKVGVLKLNSTPWSEVYIDKQHIGHTPVLGLQLPAGKHTVELQNPQSGQRKKLKIKIKAGEVLTKIEKL
jgi:hypothetical protein